MSRIFELRMKIISFELSMKMVSFSFFLCFLPSSSSIRYSSQHSWEADISRRKTIDLASKFRTSSRARIIRSSKLGDFVGVLFFFFLGGVAQLCSIVLL